MAVERINLDIRYENEHDEILFSGNDIDVVIEYYWDSHGRLVGFNGPNGNSRDEIHADTIRIVEHTYDLIHDNRSLGTHSDWQVYINGEKLKVLDIDSYNKRKRLFINAIMGTG